MKKEEEFVRIYKNIDKDYKLLSKKTGIKLEVLLQIIQNRELVLMNSQLNKIHEHLDLMESHKNPTHQQKEAV